MTSKPSFQNSLILRRPGVVIFGDIIKIVTMFIKRVTKDSGKVKKIEIMYQNPVFMWISWCSKICWIPVKKCWCQLNPSGVSRDLYIFWIFFRYGITVPSFIIVGFVWRILGRGVKKVPHTWAAPKKSILNRVKLSGNLWNNSYIPVYY